MKTMKGYQDLRLKCDVLLLVVVFENFRNSSLKHYGISSSHYLNALGSSWDAMLNMTRIELELISDANMYLFFEKGIRDEVFYISKRYSKASNNYLKSHEAKQESKIYN